MSAGYHDLPTFSPQCQNTCYINRILEKVEQKEEHIDIEARTSVPPIPPVIIDMLALKDTEEVLLLMAVGDKPRSPNHYSLATNMAY